MRPVFRVSMLPFPAEGPLVSVLSSLNILQLPVVVTLDIPIGTARENLEGKDSLVSLTNLRCLEIQTAAVEDLAKTAGLLAESLEFQQIESSVCLSNTHNGFSRMYSLMALKLF